MFLGFDVATGDLRPKPMWSLFGSPWVTQSLVVPTLFMKAKFKGEPNPQLVFSAATSEAMFPPRVTRVDWLMVLMPPWMSGASSWCMEQVQELWEIRNQSTGAIGCLYIDASAKEWVDLDPGEAPRDYVRLRKLYPFR